MKTIILKGALSLILTLALVNFTSAQQNGPFMGLYGEGCTEFLGSGNDPDVLVCCGVTYVMSGWHMSGGFAGANQGCSGSYSNFC